MHGVRGNGSRTFGNDPKHPHDIAILRLGHKLRDNRIQSSVHCAFAMLVTPLRKSTFLRLPEWL